MGRTVAVDQVLALLFALLTALSNAVALATQHVASTRRRDELSAWRLVLFLFRQPLWLVGWIALVGSLVFQALALHFGPLVEVQPFLVSELVMALLLRALWIRQRLSLLAWIGAAVTTIGLACFLLASASGAGTSTPGRDRWIVIIVVVSAPILALTLLAQRGSPARRAGLFATATGAAWALEATFIKATTNVIASNGYADILAHWPLYAFVVGGVAGLLLEQAALHVGPLRVSQPIIVIVDPIISVVLGLWLYDEALRSGAGFLALDVVAFLVMIVGVIVMTQHTPETMTAEVRTT